MPVLLDALIDIYTYDRNMCIYNSKFDVFTFNFFL